MHLVFGYLYLSAILLNFAVLECVGPLSFYCVAPNLKLFDVSGSHCLIFLKQEVCLTFENSIFT
jgi:hypothetical protein